MRSIVVLAAASLVFCAATFAWPESASDRNVKLATARLEKGRGLLGSVSSKDSNASRLATLDRAIYFLREGRQVTVKEKGDAFVGLQKEIDANLVRSLVSEAEIYFERTSVPKAKQRVEEALTIDPRNPRALDLSAMITASESASSYSGSRVPAGRETQEQRRIRERRAANGVTLRDRGGFGNAR